MREKFIVPRKFASVVVICSTVGCFLCPTFRPADFLIPRCLKWLIPQMTKRDQREASPDQRVIFAHSNRVILPGTVLPL